MEQERCEITSIKSDKSMPGNMEQGNITITSPNTVTDNSMGKNKGTSISLPTTTRLQSAKEKLKSPWMKKLIREECSPCDTVKSALAEFIGTAILVFLGCMGCVGSLGNSPPLLAAAFTFGFAVMVILQSIGHISGAHINPAITIGSVVMGKKSLRIACVYIVSQCLGGILGYGLLKVVTPQPLLYGTTGPNTTREFCITAIHQDISLMQGLLAEVIVTAILMFMTCANWDLRNARNTDSSAIKCGLAVAVLCMAEAPYTGCSMNPARSLGPALWNNSWRDHWVFWFGPIAGALLAAIAYRIIFSLDKCEKEECSVLNGVETQKPEVISHFASS